MDTLVQLSETIPVFPLTLHDRRDPREAELVHSINAWNPPRRRASTSYLARSEGLE